MDPIDFSFWALFARSTLTVKLAMLLLIFASVWVWAVTIRKVIAYRAAKRAQDRFDRAFWSGEPLDVLFADLVDKADTAPERIFVAGMTEWHRSQRDTGGMIPGATARIDRSMDVAISREADTLNAGLSWLATIGSTAPFIGLFGTVWGIMHSFMQIAISQNTSLVVVAPGIAEALLATGIGLLAAIPAVVFYNKLIGDSARIVGGYEVFADEFATLLSREVDD
jgi:biopolymer transport protein TolQ